MRINRPSRRTAEVTAVLRASDTMGRVAFALFLVFSMPIGIHHLFADPQVGAGFKFVHAVFTARRRGVRGSKGCRRRSFGA